MWELSPGMRAIAGGMRPLSPNDVAGLFFDLGPAQRKVNYHRIHTQSCEISVSKVIFSRAT